MDPACLSGKNLLHVQPCQNDHFSPGPSISSGHTSTFDGSLPEILDALAAAGTGIPYFVKRGCQLLIPRFPGGRLVPAVKFTNDQSTELAKDYMTALWSSFHPGPAESRSNLIKTTLDIPHCAVVKPTAPRLKILTRKDRHQPNPCLVYNANLSSKTPSRLTPLIRKDSHQRPKKHVTGRRLDSHDSTTPRKQVKQLKKMPRKDRQRYPEFQQDRSYQCSKKIHQRIADLKTRACTTGQEPLANPSLTRHRTKQTAKIVQHKPLGVTIHFQVRQRDGLLQWIEADDVDDSLLQAYNDQLPDGSKL